MRKPISLVSIAVVLVIDQMTKSWARTNLSAGTIQPLIPGLIRFNYTTNTGGAFGIGHNIGWFMTLLATVLTIIIAIWIVRRERSISNMGANIGSAFILERIGMGLIAGGAIGNLWDRFMLGRVTDFLEFAFVSFPVFNFADVSIDIGLALIALGLFINKTLEKQS